MAVIRIRDTQGPLQHVFVADGVEGCELETMIGAMHGSLMFRAVRATKNEFVRFDIIGPSESLAHAVATFRAICEAPPVADEAPPPA